MLSRLIFIGSTGDGGITIENSGETYWIVINATDPNVCAFTLGVCLSLGIVFPISHEIHFVNHVCKQFLGQFTVNYTIKYVQPEGESCYPGCKNIIN